MTTFGRFAHILSAVIVLTLANTNLLGQGFLVPEHDHSRMPRPWRQPVDRSYALRELTVDASIKQQVATTQVTQVFQNTGNVPIEATYVFPLPYDGAVERLTFMVDGKEYELDVVILATGFDAGTGALTRMDIHGRDGVSLTELWQKDIRSTLGLQVHGFPNLFTVAGPLAPSTAFCNMTTCLQQQVDWVMNCITWVRGQGKRTIEPTEEGQAKWTAHVAEVASKLLRRGVRNYMVHVNEDDGSRVFMPYVGGMDRYVQQARAMAANGYEGFRLR